MTSKKNIILIVIVVVLLGAAVYVLFGGSAGKKASVKTNSENNNPTSTILPHGSQLDFSQVKKYNPDSKLFDYSTVSPDNVGVSLPDILKVKVPSQ